MTHRFFGTLLRRRAAATLAVLALTAALGALATRVRPDFSVEQFFPAEAPSKLDYDRFKLDFPYGEARAVVIVEAADLWTPAGIARIAAIEKDLGALDGVIETEGLTTVRDIVAAGPDEVRVERLFPRADLPQEEIFRRRATATTDPLFAWVLAPPPPPRGPALDVEGPHAGVTSIRVLMSAPYAAKDETRMRFLHDARAVLARHDARAGAAGARQRLVLSGLPVLRSEYTELINGDTATLFPLVLGVVLALLVLVFRSLAISAAALATILFSVVWTYGAMGACGFPLQVLTSTTPIVVMIISISDTVHIAAHYLAALGDAGSSGAVPGPTARRAAIAEACAATALPCLLTEITIACGFLTLLAVDITAIREFGIATALGMMLTWLANMLVLPLALAFIPARAAPSRGGTAATRAFEAFVAWIERVVERRPRAVLGTAAAVVLAAAVFGSRIEREYKIWEDLREESPIRRSIEYIDRVYGGTVPLAIYIEPRVDGTSAEGLDEPMLDPRAISLADRLAAWLEATFPDIRAAASAADPWRKTFRLMAPEAAAAASGGLPATRAAAAQLLTVFDDPRFLRDTLSHERRAAAVVAMIPNLGAARADEIIARIEERLRAEEAATGYRITLTSVFALIDDVNGILVGGLVKSFGMAILVSFAAFCAVLRSWRLGLIGLIPNLLPIALTFAFMGLAGIALKPTTVIVFSVTLTIADDDTIQFLARFREIYVRRRAEGAPDPHAVAVSETMRETGLPMFVTACAVSLGFGMLLFSNFLGLANLGLLVGVSLFTAVFADMFLSPLVILALRPRIGAPAPAPPVAPASAP